MDSTITAPPDDEADRLLGQAADWLVTLTSGRATDDDARELAAWRGRSPEHEAAFRHVAGLTGLTRALVDNPPAPAVGRRAVLAAGAGLLAAAGLYGLVRPPLGLWPSYAELTADRRTGAGQRTTFAPAPGVSVEMNSRTSLSLADGGRGMTLVGGEALVSVGPAAAGGFEVRAGGVRAAAQAAVFNVQAIGGEIGVACVSGQVRCRRAETGFALGPDEGVTVRANGAVERARIRAGVATAWRDGMLVFENTPLSEVVRQINRYRTGDIVLADAAIGRRPVNAVLHTAQIDNAVSQIQQLLDLKVRRLPGGVILMG